MLSVTSENGCTVQQAINNLKTNCALDETQPRGTFYFTKTSDIRTRVRAKNTLDAIKILESMGYSAQIVNGNLPQGKTDVMGLTCGTAKFDWDACKSKIIPGAICDNLTSGGGAFSETTQTKLTEFLIHGAAGACGTVCEPYALQAKFPLPMVHVHYARGASLGESLYQSVAGPFQLLIVGDPLCQPFATKPAFSIKGLEPMSSTKDEISLQVDFSDSPVELSELKVYLDGLLLNDVNVSRKQTSRKLLLDTRDMQDGFHELRVVCVANNLIASATPGSSFSRR